MTQIISMKFYVSMSLVKNMISWILEYVWLQPYEYGSHYMLMVIKLLKRDKSQLRNTVSVKYIYFKYLVLKRIM